MLPSFDLVDIQSPFIYPAFLAGTFALKMNIPLFYHMRGNLLQTHLKSKKIKKLIFLQIFENKIIRNSTTLIALNQCEKDAFATIAPAVPCRIVPNGINLPQHVNLHATRKNIHKKWKISDDAQVILYLGRIHIWKRVDLLLKAFEKIAFNFPKAILVIAGKDEINLQQQTQKIFLHHSVLKRVIFTGPIYNLEKHEILSRADIFCLPSKGEGLSVSILEALAYGIPVLITPECNFPDVERYNLGRVANANENEFTKSLSFLLAQMCSRQKTREACKKYASFYNLDKISNMLIDVYSEGIARHKTKNQKNVLV